MALCSADGRILDCNRVFADLLRRPPEDLRGLHARDITPPDEWPAEERRLRRALEERHAVGHIVKRYATPDGGTVWAEVSLIALAGADGSVAGWLAIVRDRTEEFRIADRLKASDMAYQQLFTSIADGYAIFELVPADDTGPASLRCLDANPAFERLLGLPATDLVGRRLEDFWPALAGEKGTDLLRLAAGDTQAPVRTAGEFGLLGRHFDITAHRPAPGRVALAVSDVTQRHAEEIRRRQFEVRAQELQKIESLGLLAGGIAHEFNNILTAIHGGAELAKEDLAPDHPAQRTLLDIMQASRRASDVCRQLLAFAGRGRMAFEPLQLNDVIENMAHLIAITVGRHITLDLQLANRLPSIRGDPNQIGQLLINLLANASEAIGERSGSIRLSTGTESLPAGLPATRPVGEPLPPGDYVYLEVADDGPGIAPGQMDRIFDPFYSTKSPGRGLGLPAVLGIVRSHGGDLRVRSRLGEGASFRALFPVADRADVTSPSPPAPAAAIPPAPPATVLVVDDEPAVRTATGRMLEQAGFRTLAASTVAEAERVIRSTPAIAAALVDLQLPDEDGAGAIRRLRAIRPGLPIVLCSGYGESELRAILPSPPATVLAKPFVRARLIAAVQEVLGVADLPRETPTEKTG